MRLIVRVCAFVITLFACFSASNAVLAQTAVQPGQVIISELRFRGPAGAEDEFIELYNNTNSPIVVQGVNTAPGWAVAISNGQITGNVCIGPNGTVIPARGHFLCANINGYSLSNYPAGNNNCGSQNGNTLLPPQFGPTSPDAIWDFDIPDGAGVALFTTSSGPGQTAATRLDAFGFTSSPALFKEGTGFPTIPNANNEHTLYRDLSTIVPKDTNDNAADFLLVAAAAYIQTSLNGSPGPENRCSPIVNNATINVSMVDPSVSSASEPNRGRNLTPETNAPLGTLLARRTYTNNTGQYVTRLRFRTNLLTTRGSCPSPCADLRLLTSQDETVTVNQSPVPVRGLTLEENPPVIPEGGGMNSSVSADFIHLTQPLAPGASVNVVFKLGVVRGGSYRYYISIEALSQPTPPNID